MSDESPNSGEPEGFRLKPLSGPEVPDVPEDAEFEEEGPPSLADLPPADERTSKGTPISDAHVMSDAEVAEAKTLNRKEANRAQSRISRNSILKIVGLLVVIVAVVIALVAGHNSGVTTGSTTPTTPTKPTPVVKPTHKKHKKKQSGKKSGKDKKAAAKGKAHNKKKLPQVIAVPDHKAKKGGAKSSAGNKPTKSSGGGEDDRTIDGVGNTVAGHSDKLVAKAQKILEAKQYPHAYLKDPRKLKSYMEAKLDGYQVLLGVVTDKTGVLGMDVELPLGKVLLTHLQPGDLAPQITWVVVSKPDLTG